MPDLVDLFRDRFDEVRVRVAERVDGNPRREIEIAIAVGRDEPGAFAAFESKIDARVGRQQMRCSDAGHRRPGSSSRGKRNVPPLRAAR